MFYFLGDVFLPEIQNVTSSALYSYSGDAVRTATGDEIESVVREHLHLHPDYVDESDVRYVAIARVVYSYCIPSLVVYGLVSNALTCFVLSSKSSTDRKEKDDSGEATSDGKTTGRPADSSDVYVLWRSVSDALFLVVLLAVWLELVGVGRLWTRSGWCQATTYASSVTSFLSVWFTVAWSIDRTLSVFRRCGCTGGRSAARDGCTSYGTLALDGLRSTGDAGRQRRGGGGQQAASSGASSGGRSRARIVCLGLLGLAVPVYLNISLLADVVYVDSRPICATLYEYRHTVQILDRLHNVINVAIPYTIIGVASMFTIVLLCRSAFIAHHQRTANSRRSNGKNGNGKEIDAAPSTSTDLEREPPVGNANEDDLDECFRTTCVAQIASAAAFLSLCIPAFVHQMSLPTNFIAGTTHVVGRVDSVAAISVESYITQRLLLVAWYARHCTVFAVHFVVDAPFRRRCTSSIGRAICALTSRMTSLMGGRRRVVCCERNSSANFDVRTVVVDGLSVQTAGGRSVAV